MRHPPELPEITPIELKRKLDRGDVPILVDVREHFERHIADLPEHGQLRIPTWELLQRLHEIDRGRVVVAYCRSGHRSLWAQRLLRERGVEEVLNLKGGILGWREHVDPTLRAY